MIEDDDMFQQNEKLLPAKDEDEGKSHLMLILLIVWILWTAALSLYFVPKVITAVEDSGVISLIKEQKSQGEAGSSLRTVSATYVTLEGAREYTFTTERRGGSKFHDIVEALIAGAPEEALSDGAVSLINPDTRLIGLSYGSGILYVDLSSDFLESNSLDGKYTAADELRDSLLQDGIEKVVIMIEGEVQNL